MARTKKAARKQASNYSRETIKEHSKEKQEVKKSKHNKKNNKKQDTSAQAGPSDPPITGSEPTEMSIDPPASTSTPATSSADTESLGDLASTHDVLRMSIISSTQMEKKVTAILKYLDTPEKAAVVMLHSKAKVASKLISIVEIAKREIAAGGGKWFQYNVVEGVLEEKSEGEHGEDEGGVKIGEVDNIDVEDEEEEEESFETMKTPFERAIEGKPKVRAVPGMTTYLSRVRIDRLGKKYGEQTNGLETDLADRSKK
ncbi:hypothetical protein LHYA1_G006715 [Lachnellula hyalina]|uniref:DNA/RNA-binding protein Alba-like domain-containing protein n=1 Tax=Lachnellula hyalina TaxID=1316788 RepID=A0A8H8TVU5_9HELO|nr:uncharacterized protein LHYA1_G006715 [Lachnellula hyalina]TVY23742.1 hypothetical protein LHYA1_G006715 [Lachnellula hyalina]